MPLISQAGGFLFGEETTPGVAAGDKNNKLGIPAGELKWPFEDYTIKEFRGGDGTRDAILQKHKQADLKGNLSIYLQHAWPIYWVLGAVQDQDNGDGTFTHTITGANTVKSATFHRMIGDGTTSFGIDHLGNYAEEMELVIEENDDLKFTSPYQSLDIDDLVTAQTPAQLDRNTYQFDEATWNFLNPGTSDPLTGLSDNDETGDMILKTLTAKVNNNLSPIRGHKDGVRFPLKYVVKKREHDLDLSLVPNDNLELYRVLVRDRTRFDFNYRLTRAANDYLELQFRDCLAKTSPHPDPEDQGEITVDLTIKPRVTRCVVRDVFSTLLAASQ